MAKLHTYIANTSKYFTKNEEEIIKSGVKAAEQFISEHFELDYEVDIIVTAPSFLLDTIKEEGIGARIYSSTLIAVVIDKSQAKITEGAVYGIVCHEMSHSLRWEKLPEYSKTMFDVMIFEGLATVLEEKAVTERGDDPQFFLQEVQKTSSTQIQKTLNLLGKSLFSKDYDYETTFFTGNDKLPRWAGYKLGYYFVKKYLNDTERTIEQATLDSYKLFYNKYHDQNDRAAKRPSTA